MSKDRCMVPLIITRDLRDRIGVAAKRQGRTFGQEVSARLVPFYYRDEGLDIST